jgi:hypothetical protein
MQGQFVPDGEYDLKGMVALCRDGLYLMVSMLRKVGMHCAGTVFT